MKGLIIPKGQTTHILLKKCAPKEYPVPATYKTETNLSMCDVKIFLTFTSPNMVLL